MNKSTRDKIAVALGSSLDWYDFALYGFFASTFSNLFFPIFVSDHKNLMLTFATWFMGFAARPLGAIIFGYIGDKYGRVVCFKISSVLILLPVILFPILPTYNQIGIYAPLLLVCLRIIQGICIGGEFAGNIIYLCESSPKAQNYFFGSLGSCTGSFGILLASIASSIVHYSLPIDDVNSFGWRLAFAFAIILSFISLKMRRSIRETQDFENTRSANSSYSITVTLRDNWQKILLGCGIICLHATSFYMIFIFFPTFANKYLQISSAASFTNNSILLFIRILIIPIIGMTADKIGGKIMLQVSSALFLILSLPLLYIMTYAKDSWFYVALSVLALMTTLNAGTVPGLLIKIFPANIRYFCLSFSFNISFGILGGMVPSLSIYLIEKFGSNLMPAFYLMIVSLITFISLHFFVKESI